ncbi:hypothetical protein MSG28_006414 [Choristoneura fumiferana]|uniref:Uncharacterized protein n=1 Tax=Choristoneura fumiferana TaxID=7141 RepID=A0ACC0JEY2_CHOFU|nr:hypothetical protein MSG28_006414 [Choristoneura fumiferana]
MYMLPILESPLIPLQVMVLAYLEAKPDTNVVVLDWSNMALGSYLFNAAGKNVKKVGAAAAKQLNRLLETGIKLEDLHVIGHSLGSHVAGYIARELKNKYNKTVKRLTLLDPAVIGLLPDVVLEHVGADDAEFVEVIHTDAGSYGTTARTGTADFFPNGGKGPQPGCPPSPRFALYPITIRKMSSHSRSWWFYAESLRNPKAFPASPAKSYREFKQNPTPDVGMVYMGIACDTR